MRRISARLATTAAAAVVVAVTAIGGPASASGVDQEGLLFTQTNASGGNHVVAIRVHDGRLTKAGSWATGGRGSGPIGIGDASGAVALADHGRVVIAVNTGSDTVTTFEQRVTGLRRLNVAPTGAMPISVTVHDDVAYVLNKEARTISGFRLGGGGLVPLPGSSRHLTSGTSDPAQVSFDPAGRRLVVTNRGSDSLDVFTVGPAGYASTNPVNTVGDGHVPFGFAFTPSGRLVVSNAEGPPSSTVSAYRIAPDRHVVSIGAALPNHQDAACWVVVTAQGNYAYVANANSGSITGLRVAPNGALALLNASGVTATTSGLAPLDLATSPNSRYVFGLAGDPATFAFKVISFRVNAGGSLTRVSAVGYPFTLTGLAAE